MGMPGPARLARGRGRVRHGADKRLPWGTRPTGLRIPLPTRAAHRIKRFDLRGYASKTRPRRALPMPISYAFAAVWVNWPLGSVRRGQRNAQALVRRSMEGGGCLPWPRRWSTLLLPGGVCPMHSIKDIGHEA